MPEQTEAAIEAATQPAQPIQPEPELAPPALFLCPNCAASHQDRSAIEETTGDNVSYCPACAASLRITRCIQCDETFQRSATTSVAQGRVCDPCSDDYHSCSSCGEFYHSDDLHYQDEDSRELCSPCYNRAQRRPSIIQHYSAKPTLIPTGHGPHFLGLELEVECDDADDREARADDMLGLFPSHYLIVKDDGSLDAGFELCTRPATLEEHKKAWSRFTRPPRGVYSWTAKTTGLHVHLSRAPLSDLQIAKMIILINALRNRSSVERLAGRTCEQYARIADKKPRDIFSTDTKRLRAPSRYEAINLQNSETIEIRIFKGTLKRESIFRALEFCHALREFTAPASTSLEAAQSFAGFAAWVLEFRARRDLYPNLSAWLRARGHKAPSDDRPRGPGAPAQEIAPATDTTTSER